MDGARDHLESGRPRSHSHGVLTRVGVDSKKWLPAFDDCDSPEDDHNFRSRLGRWEESEDLRCGIDGVVPLELDGDRWCSDGIA
jgi:hypothetical protein